MASYNFIDCYLPSIPNIGGGTDFWLVGLKDKTLTHLDADQQSTDMEQMNAVAIKMKGFIPDFHNEGKLSLHLSNLSN